jgi:hypothetical protein
MPNRAWPNILTQSRAAVQAEAPALLCHSSSGRIDGNFSKNGLKIFVEKGEVEQM